MKNIRRLALLLSAVAAVGLVTTFLFRKLPQHTSLTVATMYTRKHYSMFINISTSMKIDGAPTVLRNAESTSENHQTYGVGNPAELSDPVLIPVGSAGRQDITHMNDDRVKAGGSASISDVAEQRPITVGSVAQDGSVESTHSCHGEDDSRRTTGSNAIDMKCLASTNDKRIRRIQEHCKRLSSYRMHFGARFFIPNLGTWYCSIDKCASTTWHYVLVKLSQRNCSNSNIVSAHSCAANNIVHGVETVEPNVSLITVRNPWTRLASAYIDKVAYHITRFAKTCYDYYSQDFQTAKSPLTFTQFVRCILFQSKTNQTIDAHFRLQSDLCPFCERASAPGLILAKVETLEADLRYFMDVVGVRDERELHMAELLANSPKRENEKERQTERQYKTLYESLDKETLSDLSNWLRLDCEIFQYPLHPLQQE